MADNEQTNWDYVSDAPKDQARKTASITWEASEYIDHRQGPVWFAGLMVITAAIAAGFYFLTHDYFAVGTVAIVGILVGVFAKRTPSKLNYQLSADGLKIEEKTYPFSLFKSFSIVEEGPISSVELLPLKRFMPPVSAFFETADKNKITEVLGNYLPYEERRLDAVERLSRRLRF